MVVKFQIYKLHGPPGDRFSVGINNKLNKFLRGGAVVEYGPNITVVMPTEDKA